MTRAEARTLPIKTLQQQGFLYVADLPKHKRMVETEGKR